MPTVQIWGNPASTCTQRVVAVCKAKELDWQIVSPPGFDFIRDATYIEERQPFSKMPAIQDGDFKLYESRAICMYLAAKYANQGVSLLPPSHDIESNAKVQQAAFSEAFNFDPSASGIAVELVFKLRRGGQTDQNALDNHIMTLEKYLAGYEVILGKQKYAAGDKLTVVDIFFLPYATMAIELGKLDLTKFPNFKRYFEETSSLPFWKYALEQRDLARQAMQK